MARDTRVQAQIDSLDERVARLRFEKSRMLARASRTERKRDTRRKILIGAAVLAAIDRDGVPVIRTTSELLHWLDTRLSRPHDRDVFGLRAIVDDSPVVDAGGSSPDGSVKDATLERHRALARSRP